MLSSTSHHHVLVSITGSVEEAASYKAHYESNLKQAEEIMEILF